MAIRESPESEEERPIHLNIEMFRALGDPVRLAIFLVLLEVNEAHSVTKIAQETGRNFANVSQHLRILRRSELVHCVRSGKERLYKANPEKLRAEIKSFLAIITKKR